MHIRNVSQQDVSGKVGERDALYDFATDVVSPDAMSVEIIARRSSVGLQDKPAPDPARAPRGHFVYTVQY